MHGEAMFGAGAADQARLEAGIQVVTVVSGSIAVLSPVQAQLSGWLPTPVSVGLSVGGVTVALTAQVGQQVVSRRRARLERQRITRDLLRHPDLPTAHEVDLQDLGVYRPRPEYAEAPYVSRDVDADLEAALGRSHFVVVLGPRLAGKTRSLAEAVRRTCGDAQLICPRSPASLERLFDPAVPVRVTGRSAVLWLDDLDRYLGVLDDAHLERLAGAAIDVTVVGTLTDESFEDAVGQTASRRLVEAAEVVRLPAELSSPERQRARAVLGRPVTSPLGAEIALHVAGTTAADDGIAAVDGDTATETADDDTATETADDGTTTAGAPSAATPSYDDEPIIVIEPAARRTEATRGALPPPGPQAGPPTGTASPSPGRPPSSTPHVAAPSLRTSRHPPLPTPRRLRSRGHRHHPPAGRPRHPAEAHPRRTGPRPLRSDVAAPR